MTSTVRVEWIQNRTESSPSLSQSSLLTESENGDNDIMIDHMSNVNVDVNSIKNDNRGDNGTIHISSSSSSGNDGGEPKKRNSASSLQDIQVQEPGLWKYSKTRQFTFW